MLKTKKTKLYLYIFVTSAHYKRIKYQSNWLDCLPGTPLFWSAGFFFDFGVTFSNVAFSKFDSIHRVSLGLMTSKVLLFKESTSNVSVLLIFSLGGSSSMSTQLTKINRTFKGKYLFSRDLRNRREMIIFSCIKTFWELKNTYHNHDQT